MDEFHLSIAAMAANSDFGKSELIGHYHNKALFYVNERKKMVAGITPLAKCKEWIVNYISSLPVGALVNISQTEIKELTRKILNEIDLEITKTPFSWTGHPGFSRSANNSIASLLKLMESFFDPNLGLQEGKIELEQWQKETLKKKLSNSEKIILSGAGAISRYSLAFWFLNGVSTENPAPSNLRSRKCKKDVEIPVAAKDVLGAIMGGLIGFGFGGPGGAVVGTLAGGTTASAT